MLTTTEVAERMGVSYQTVMSWHRNGKLPNAIRETSPRGDYWLIPETDLEGLTKRGRGRPAKSEPETKPAAKKRAGKKAGN